MVGRGEGLALLDQRRGTWEMGDIVDLPHDENLFFKVGLSSNCDIGIK